MASRRKFRHEDIAQVPRGWHVRTKRQPDGTELRIAFPPGRRKKGAGKLISILHPIKNAAKKSKRKNAFDWGTAGTALIAGAAGTLGAGLTGSFLRNGKHKRRKKNAKDGAADLYESFHGRAPSEILELQEEIVRSGDYAALGDMGGLWLHPVKGDPGKWGKADIEFDAKDDVKLAASPESSQLYLIGGDQELPTEWLKKLGQDLEKQFIPLGTVYGISYLTEKAFDGFERSEYVHELGEETGERPTAFYDQKSKRILLAGGHYYIALDKPDLGMSPGIVN